MAFKTIKDKIHIIATGKFTPKGFPTFEFNGSEMHEMVTTEYIKKESLIKLINKFKPRMNGTMIVEFDCMIEELKQGLKDDDMRCTVCNQNKANAWLNRKPVCSKCHRLNKISKRNRQELKRTWYVKRKLSGCYVLM